MKMLAFFFLIVLSTSVHSQVEPTTIKISVDTPVELSVEKVVLSIALTPPDQEYEMLRDRLWELHTKLRYDSEEEEKEINDKINAELEKFEPLYVNDFISELDAAGITKRIQIGNGELSEYYSDVIDTVIYVTLHNSDEMNTLNSLSERYPCEVDLEKTVYEPAERHDEETYPILVEKATKKASILAKSMNKRIVRIEECSNVYPLSMRPKFYDELADFDFKLGNSYVSNAFDQTKIHHPSLIFTFIVE